jgi:hypothetical protein
VFEEVGGVALQEVFGGTPFSGFFQEGVRLLFADGAGDAAEIGKAGLVRIGHHSSILLLFQRTEKLIRMRPALPDRWMWSFQCLLSVQAV